MPKSQSKYDPLGELLHGQSFPNGPLWLSLREIEGLVGPLPKEAATQQFWANTEHYHSSRRRQWMGHGYRAYFSEDSGGEPGVSFRPVVDMTSLFPDEAVAKDSPNGWTDGELRCCVTTYHQLLLAQSNNVRLSKAALRRKALAEGLPSRSAAAYEFRMQNISAVLEEMGLETVKGYLPRRHVGSVKARLVALINTAWNRDDLLEEATSDEMSLKTRVMSARLKYRKGALDGPPPGRHGVAKLDFLAGRFLRDPNIVGWVLEAARGICEVCSEPAPFLKEDGEPYLEVHHVRWLSEGGPDTTDNAVACCPNCHRKLHFSANRSSLRKQIMTTVTRIIDHPKAKVTSNRTP
jgi:5-methylcytosine-specific restriction protein A